MGILKKLFNNSEKPVEFGAAVGTKSYRGHLPSCAESNSNAAVVDEQTHDFFKDMLKNTVLDQVTDFEMLKAVVSGNDQVNLASKDEVIDGVAVQVFGSMSVTPPEGAPEIANELVANLARLASGMSTPTVLIVQNEEQRDVAAKTLQQDPTAAQVDVTIGDGEAIALARKDLGPQAGKLRQLKQ